MKRIIHQLKKHEKQIMTYSIMILALILLSILFIKTVALIVTVCMFIFINVVLKFYKRVFPGIPIEFEITTFGSVVTTIAFGVWAGLIVALLSCLFAEFLNQRISPNSFVNMIIYLLIPLLSLLLNPSNVIMGGLIICIIINVIIYFIFMFVMHYDFFKNTLYSLSNILWNYLLFTYLAVPILKVIMIG
jgi:hypothetical protein